MILISYLPVRILYTSIMSHLNLQYFNVGSWRPLILQHMVGVAEWRQVLSEQHRPRTINKCYNEKSEFYCYKINI